MAPDADSTHPGAVTSSVRTVQGIGTSDDNPATDQIGLSVQALTAIPTAVA
jgi:hypothetical protein